MNCRRFGYLVTIMMLGACNATTKEERMAEFQRTLPTMSCAEITQEISYQERIAAGILERQEQGVTVGDFPATALMLGVNVAMNQSNKTDRDERLHELNEKMTALAAKRSEKCKP